MPLCSRPNYSCCNNQQCVSHSRATHSYRSTLTVTGPTHDWATVDHLPGATKGTSDVFRFTKRIVKSPYTFNPAPVWKTKKKEANKVIRTIDGSVYICKNGLVRTMHSVLGADLESVNVSGHVLYNVYDCSCCISDIP